MDDLCGTSPEGFWDVVYGVDGWVIYAPDRTRYVHNSTAWVAGDQHRGSGTVTRDQAKQEAERLYSIR